jgi:hypothetical protein
MDKDKLQRVLKGDFGMDENELIEFLQKNMHIGGAIINNYGRSPSLSLQITIKGTFITGFYVDLPEAQIIYK